MTDGRHGTSWFALAVAAFGLSTLFALLLALSRTPGVAEWFPAAGFFRRALVLHVDLAILVWFLSFAALCWTRAGGDRSDLGAAFWCSLAGTGLMALAPFFPGGEVLLSDYIPVLLNAPFLTGLGLFSLGIALAAIQFLVRHRGAPDWLFGSQDPVLLGTTLVAVAVLCALASGLLALIFAEAGSGVAAHVVAMTWSVGHVLQFANALLLATTWLVLAGEAGLDRAWPRRWTRGLLWVGLLPAVLGPLLYLLPLDPATVHGGFRYLMMIGGWSPSVPLGLLLLWALLRQPLQALSGVRLPLLVSTILCLVGIAFGLLIRDNSAMVPAHYHGTVGALTLALMAVGWRHPALTGQVLTARFACAQTWFYGGGLLVLMTGLAWSGFHGAPRKVAGLAGVGPSGEGISGLVLVGIGGSTAVIGALMFVLPVLAVLWSRRARLINGSIPAEGRDRSACGGSL